MRPVTRNHAPAPVDNRRQLRSSITHIANRDYALPRELCNDGGDSTYGSIADCPSSPAPDHFRNRRYSEVSDFRRLPIRRERSRLAEGPGYSGYGPSSPIAPMPDQQLPADEDGQGSRGTYKVIGYSTPARVNHTHNRRRHTKSDSKTSATELEGTYIGYSNPARGRSANDAHNGNRHTKSGKTSVTELGGTYIGYSDPERGRSADGAHNGHRYTKGDSKMSATELGGTYIGYSTSTRGVNSTYKEHSNTKNDSKTKRVFRKLRMYSGYNAPMDTTDHERYP